MNISAYFQGVLAELRKVSWPTPITVFRHFISVLLGIAFATAVVGIFDYVFIKLLAYIIK